MTLQSKTRKNILVQLTTMDFDRVPLTVKSDKVSRFSFMTRKIETMGTCFLLNIFYIFKLEEPGNEQCDF